MIQKKKKNPPRFSLGGFYDENPGKIFGGIFT